MANKQVGQIHYVDATGTLTSSRVKVARVLVTATSANGVLELSDSSDNSLMYIGVPTSGSTVHLDFALNPVVFQNGLKIKTLTTAKATVVYTSTGAGD